MNTGGRALTESVMLHGVLIGMVLSLVSLIRPQIKTMCLDFTLLEKTIPPVQAPKEIPKPIEPLQPPQQVREKPKEKPHNPIRKQQVKTPSPEPALVPWNSPPTEEQPLQDDVNPTPGPIEDKNDSATMVQPPLEEKKNPLLQYLSQIRAKVEERKIYPFWAKSHGIEGDVSILFILSLDGSIAKVRIKKSSGKESLDQAAMDAVRSAAPLPLPPTGLLNGPTPMQLTIVFRLIESNR